ncbi:sigma-70 family RNA polymerase sigma factor [Rurimicrobium arvi]|uniref:Sigma-70 family RNA polymerase sigma factor n=1 Tax=Rurimicrobium arvi TaxID=2049916 RepID=A0ABP8N247_9BACT
MAHSAYTLFNVEILDEQKAITVDSIAGNALLSEDLLLLIEGCRKKDRRSQKALYDRFAPMLYSRIRRYVTEQSEVNELLNETFFKILTHLDSYSFSGAFEGWMHRIAMNTITDFLRRHIKHKQRIVADTEDIHSTVPENVLAGIGYKELLLLIHGLPEVHRGVFNLFVFDNCSHKEIAEHLGITEANSRWHLNDARRRLKEKLDALR